MTWWTKEPLRIVEICDAMDIGAVPLAREAEAVARLGGNVQHFHCMDHAARGGDSAGLNDRRLFFETRVAKQKNPDRLKMYLPLAHRKGIRVVVYFNVHWYSRQFGEEHPDWRQIKHDGRPMDDVYTTGTSLCVNGPWREWVFQVLRDLCKYEIDGIFYDGPIFFANSCYCETCRRLFRERTGEDLPDKADRQGPMWRELIDSQTDSLARFLADSEAVIKGINPEILFYMNGNSNWPYWPTGRDNRKIIAHTDALLTEGGFLYGDLNQGCIHKPGIAAKFLACQSAGKPALGANCLGHKSWSWYMLPETEIRLLFAETLAGGGNFWTALFPNDLGQPALGVVEEYFRWMQRNPGPFHSTRSAATVGLLWPSHTCNVYAGSSVPLTDFTKKIEVQGVGDLAAEFLGFYEALVQAQVPFDVLDEDSLGDLSRYELLVLPNIPAMTPGAADAIRGFVKKGGNLVADFETSLYDPRGKRLDNFSLADLLGVDFGDEVFGPMKWDYVVPEGRSAGRVLEGITKKFIPAPDYGIKVRPTMAKTLIRYCGRLAGCYEHAPKACENPMLLVNRFGKGKVFYLAGTFGCSLHRFRFPEYLALVRNLARLLSRPRVEIQNAPAVEVALREKDGTYYLHLINLMGGMKRPLTWLHPQEDLAIRVDLDVSRARALRLNRQLTVRKKNDGRVLVLPRLNDYEVIALS